MFSVVILSAKIDNVRQNVAAIRKHQPGTRVIVVQDGIKPMEQASADLVGVEWIEGAKPFCFARNANLGIAAAGTDDVVLVNDDAFLLTKGGFDNLAKASEHYGIVSSTVLGRCCNVRQKTQQENNVTEPDFLAFVCVYLPRRTLELLGPLDERFEHGTWEDNDYCRRAHEAGLSLGICGKCLVSHDNQNTTFETLPVYRQILDQNRARFEEKWSKTKTSLSICICSIFSRKHFLDRMMAILSPQLGQRVELLLAIDAGQESIGKKRQRLLEQARGEFIVFLDDDDTVHQDYVSKVLTAINRTPNVDAITYRSKRYCDGVYEAECVYSLHSESNVGFIYVDGFKTYQRYPYHVTPVRRELALKIGFPDKDHCEDTDFAVALRPLLRSEHHIPEHLYTYWWRSDRSAEQTHRSLTAPKKPKK